MGPRVLVVGSAIVGSVLASWWNPSADGTVFTPIAGTDYEAPSNKGVANGYAGLDGAGLVPVANLPGLPAAWGSITGVLSAQTDLQTALDGKEASGAFSGIGACAANQWASTLNDTAAPSCTQPGFGNLSGTATIGQGGTGQTSATAAFDALDPLTSAGDILTHNGTNSARLAKGTANQVLAMNAGATAVEWQTPGAGAGIVSAIKLTSNATANATTTGVEITGLNKTLTAGTYSAKYVIVYQSAATTTGVSFGVNYTGTATTFVCNMDFAGTGTSASTGAATQVASGATGNVGERFATRSESTTAPDLGATVSVDALNSNMLAIVECLLITSNGGDLELWHASEVAASSQVMAGTALILTTL